MFDSSVRWATRRSGRAMTAMPEVSVATASITRAILTGFPLNRGSILPKVLMSESEASSLLKLCNAVFLVNWSRIPQRYLSCCFSAVLL